MATFWRVVQAPDQVFRRRRLRELAEHPDFGGRAALGRALGYKDGAYVRQMIDGERTISEKTIVAVHELRGGKFRGWFDAAPAAPTASVVQAREPAPPGDFSGRAPPSASEWSVLEDLRVLPQRERDALLADVHNRAELFRAYTREIIDRARGGSER